MQLSQSPPPLTPTTILAFPAAAVAQQAQQPPSSPYMGVSWCTRQRGWVAEIWDGLQYLNLGLFATEADAARAYDLACLEQHGG